jgi:hypothetical protein
MKNTKSKIEFALWEKVIIWGAASWFIGRILVSVIFNK